MEDFQADDELYVCLTGDKKMDVLATARSKVTGKEYPMALAMSYGKGRVFNTPLGPRRQGRRHARHGKTPAARRPLGRRKRTVSKTSEPKCETKSNPKQIGNRRQEIQNAWFRHSDSRKNSLRMSSCEYGFLLGVSHANRLSHRRLQLFLLELRQVPRLGRGQRRTLHRVRADRRRKLDPRAGLPAAHRPVPGPLAPAAEDGTPSACSSRSWTPLIRCRAATGRCTACPTC